MKKGNLYLVPTPLASLRLAETLPSETLHVLQTLQHWVVETAKIGRAILKEAGSKHPQPSLQLQLLNEHTPKSAIDELLMPALEGYDLGLMSDAGCPGIADPGALLVSAAHRNGVRVVPLVGPTSIALALMASGFNGQNFVFNGYLPVDKLLRKKQLRHLDELVHKHFQTQLFIETPYRNQVLLQEILACCKPQTMLCVCGNLTATDAFIKVLSVAQWRTQPIQLAKIPTIFVLGTIQ